MGGPMYYARLVNRNGLTGWGYMANKGDPRSPDIIWGDHPSATDRCISRGYFEGEMRRMEIDTFDETRIAAYAKAAGIEKEQAALLLRTFLGIPEPGCEKCNTYFKYQRGDTIQLGRCSDHVVW